MTKPTTLKLQSAISGSLLGWLSGLLLHNCQNLAYHYLLSGEMLLVLLLLGQDLQLNQELPLVYIEG